MIKILIAGDFCPLDRVSKLIDTCEYQSILKDIIQYTAQADYSIVNLEAPVVHTEEHAIDKCGPNLKCSDNAVKALKYAGFDMTTLANNHFYDYGDIGVKQTLEACINNGIDVVGGGINLSNASKTFYKDIRGVKVAFINCCEHEFSIASDSSAGANPLNLIQQYYSIQEAKQLADITIVIVHGGPEHYQLPTPRMKESYRFFIDAGADAVINHHQHCFSGYEIHKNKPIFYGLGNLCFDWPYKRNLPWNRGYMVMLEIESEKVNFKLIPYIQCNDKPCVDIIKDVNDIHIFYEHINYFNSIIQSDNKLQEEYNAYLEKSKSQYLALFEPYSNRYLKALYRRRLLPTFISKNKRLMLFNYMNCYSHLEKLLYALKYHRK